MLHTIYTNEKESIIKVSGSTQLVEEGMVTKETLHPIHHNQFRFGLGVGSFSDEQALGEAIILDSKHITSHMAKGTWITKDVPHMSSPFMVGVDAGQHAGAFLQYTNASPLSLDLLYSKLLGQYRSGVLVVGYGKACNVQCTGLKRSPTAQKNIMANHGEYISEVSFIKNQGICFVGLALPTVEKDPLVERIFVHSPRAGEGGSFLTKSTVAVLAPGSIALPNTEHAFLESIKNSSVVRVGHMSPQSTLEESAFLVYPIKEIQSVEKPKGEPKRCRETLRFPFTQAPSER